MQAARATPANQAAQAVLPFHSGAARPVRHAPGLLDQVRQALGQRHASLKTEQATVYWVKFFIRWHGMRHPRELGSREVEAFLAMLRQRRDLPPASWGLAASALAFLYRDVLGRPITTPAPQVVRPISASRTAHALADWDWFGANQENTHHA